MPFPSRALLTMILEISTDFLRRGHDRPGLGSQIVDEPLRLLRRVGHGAERFVETLLQILNRGGDEVDGLAHSLQHGGQVEGLATANRSARRDDLYLFSPGVHLHELVPDQTISLNGRDRVDPDQRMKIFANPQLDAKGSGWTGRHVNALDLAGVHPRDAHLRSVLKSRDVGELGIHLERVAEQHAPVADQKQADAEKQDPRDDESSDGRLPERIH